MVVDFDEVADFFAVAEGLSHDSDEHIQKMDNHEELCYDVCADKKSFLARVSNAIRVRTRGP